MLKWKRLYHLLRCKIKHGGIADEYHGGHCREGADLGTRQILSDRRTQVPFARVARPRLTAPVVAYQPVGKINFSVGETPSRSVALVSHEDVAEAGWFKRIWQTLLQFRAWNWKYIGAGIAVMVFIPIGVLLVASARNRSRTHKRRRVKRF